jgi:hypothetical protein
MWHNRLTLSILPTVSWAAMSVCSPSYLSSSKRSCTSAKQVHSRNAIDAYLPSGRHNRRNHFRPRGAQPVQPLYVGQHRSNYTRTLEDCTYRASLRRGSRIAKGVHVATLEKSVLLTWPRNGVRLARQQCVYILAYPRA